MVEFLKSNQNGVSASTIATKLQESCAEYTDMVPATFYAAVNKVLKNDAQRTSRRFRKDGEKIKTRIFLVS